MASGPSLHLSYQVSSLAPTGTRPAYLASRLISSYIGYGLVMSVLVLLVPRFEVVFSNFKLDVPRTTVALIQLSHICREFYLWAFLSPIPAMWAVTNINIADKYRRRRVRLYAFIFVAAFLIFTLLALLLPMYSLIGHGK